MIVRYKRFLREMPELIDVDKKVRHVDPVEAGPGTGIKRKKTKYNNEYEVHHDRLSGTSMVGYSLVHKPTGKTHIKLTGGQSEGTNKLGVKNLVGHSDSKVKAHEFYHHLITKHGLEISSDDEQSVGGAKVWKKLSEYPDIHTTHHHYNGHEIPLHKGDNWFRNYHDQDSEDDDHLASTYFTARKK